MTTKNSEPKNKITDKKNETSNEIIIPKIQDNLLSSNLHNPYINTTLVCPVMLLPSQMDNKFYLHLKSNLKNKLESKCYKNYGFIKKIYSITDKSDSIVEPEDPTCSAKIIVKFNCCVYLPIIGKEIICKIDRMNKELASAINGPITAIITTDKINKDNFYIDINRNIRIKGTSEIIKTDTFIKVLVLSRSFADYDKNILVIGFMQNIANQDEISKFYNSNIDASDIDEIID